jgi:hypothetical protein
VSEWDDIEAEYQAPTASTRIPMAARVVAQIDALEDELAELRRKESKDNSIGNPYTPQILPLAERIEELAEQARASEREFVFAGVGRKKFSDIAALHPPTKEQKDQAEEAGITREWNPETFPAALMAVSLVSPAGMTPERMQRIYDNWSVGVLAKMWAACWAANQGVNEVPKSLTASVLLHGFERNSTIADLEESPDLSSLAG